MLGVCCADGKRGVANVILEPLATRLVSQLHPKDVLVEVTRGLEVTHRVGQKCDGLNHCGACGQIVAIKHFFLKHSTEC